MDEKEQLQKEMTFTYVQSSGPGGQNVNKVATAVQLRLDIRNSRLLTEETKIRLEKIGGKRVTSEGILVIEAKRYRLQEKNKADAIDRVMAMIEKAQTPLKARKPTRPNLASKEKRVDAKKRIGVKKQNRKSRTFWE